MASTLNNFMLICIVRVCWVQEDYLESLEKMRKDTGNKDFDLDETRTPFQLQIEARVQAMDIADV